MTYLVRQCQLWYLGWYATIVIHESYNTGVQGSLRGLIQTGHGLGVSLELLADTAGRAGRGSDPGKSEGASGEISVQTRRDINLTVYIEAF